MIDLESNLSELVYKRPGLVLVLERLGIYPGFLNKTIYDLAIEHGLNPDLLRLLMLLQIEPDNKPEINLKVDDIKVILNYLTAAHEYFAQELFPIISENIDVLAEGNSDPSIKMVSRFFSDYRNEANKHFDYENKKAFPYIISLLENNKVLNLDLSNAYSVDTYKENHDNIEEKLKDLKLLLIKYLPHDSNYRIRRNIILTLHRLDHDLTAHAKIENEILIPLVHKLETNSMKS